MVRIFSDILLALDTGDLCMLTLRDLSAAFDTVDHDTLLRRLEVPYGLGGTVLSCSLLLRVHRATSSTHADICSCNSGMPDGGQEP